MISLKKFLSPEGQAGHALVEAVHVLFEGIARDGAWGEAAEFRAAMQQIAHAIEAEMTPEELPHAHSAIQALGEHHREFEQRHAAREAEFQAMVRMLTATVAAISAAGAVSLARLAEIETQVAAASELDDVRLIKGRLGDCLEAIRGEAERQRQETSETIGRLRQAIEGEDALEPAASASEPDPVTRLRQRPAAEKALCEAAHSGTHAFAAVLVLDRLQALNLRFGRSIGDEVLSAFTESVEMKLSPGDQLFRWGGPALVALISHAGNIEQARGDISRIVDAKLEHNIDTGSRSILVPIGARWAVFPMMAAPRLLYKRIDTFASVMTRE